MPIPLSMALRQSIVACHKKGEKVASLSRRFKVSRKTIYTLIEREKADGIEGLQPHYNNCGKLRPNEGQFIFRAVRCMRTWHPNWGSEKIHAELQSMRPQLELPHYRTFNRWFHWNNQLDLSIKSNLPKSHPKQAKRLHEGWQIDAKEELTIADDSKNCWLNIIDEYSGTVIDPPVFSL